MRGWQLFCVVLCLGASSSFAANADTSAEHFVKSIYAPFAAEHFKPVPREIIYSKEMLALIQRDIQLAGGEIGYLNDEPLCRCMDFEPFVTDIRVESSHNASRAHVAFTNDGNFMRLILLLRRESGHWRVDDVIDADSSLKDSLVKANNEAAQAL